MGEGRELHVVVLLVAMVAEKRVVVGAGWEARGVWVVSVWSLPTEERAQ